MPRVFIPPAVRELVGGAETVDAEGSNVRAVLDDLERRFPGTKERFVENGELRPGMSVVVGGAFSSLGLLHRVGPDDEVHFLPTLGGG
ncbi:MAG: MoaD/ThiS family protein [Pirellulaceae bacterium]|jgi:molybdopterin synthase sulfur carrier subunit|nr:MoaD/ThiS family protein [Pirellulaceae bacterium]MDP7015886.1 MoaD/ThiS family protein [Pirellulaceae bacterium]